MGYTHEYSNFPDELYTLHNYQDADDSVAPLINMIRMYMANGNYTQAKFYIEQNKEVLAPYLLNMETMNGLEEETRNLEIFAKVKQQSVYFSSEEPDEPEVNDVWITSED